MTIPERPELLAMLAARTPLYRPGFPFILMATQKAGSTFLVRWFFWQIDLLGEASAYRQAEFGLAVHRYEYEVFKSADQYKENIADAIQSGVPLVNFMRCPFERVFSSFMELNNRRFSELLEAGRSSPAMEIRRAVLQRAYGEDVPLDYPLSFGDYLDWLAEQDISTVEGHHRQQTGPQYTLPGVRHYRLLEAGKVLARLEEEFGLKRSDTESELFASGHHHAKAPLGAGATKLLLERGVPMNRPKTMPLPSLDRAMLEQLGYGRAIADIFRDDLRLYDSLG